MGVRRMIQQTKFKHIKTGEIRTIIPISEFSDWKRLEENE